VRFLCRERDHDRCQNGVSQNYTSFCIEISREQAARRPGSALDDLRDFPESARREAGYQIDRVQNGFDPTDWKPIIAIGPGVREIRIRDVGGAFRIIYVASFAEAIHGLHCFQKKTRATSNADLSLATSRYRDLMQELSK
jgi:phage-related protein